MSPDVSEGEPFWLLNPGPINVPAAVRQALADCPDRCHREPEYLACQTRVREALPRVFGIEADYEAALLTGSGTAAMEAMVGSVVGDGVLVLENGVYGDRLARMAEVNGIVTRRLVTGWFERHDPAAIEAALDDDIDTIAVVHHETTVGLLNDLEAVAEIAHRTGRRLVIDSVSGLAGEAFDFAKIRPTAVCCTANKCIEGLPGIAFVFVRKDAELRQRSVYLDIGTMLAKQRQGDTPFTPAIQVMAAFEAALTVLAEETVDGRIARYKRAGDEVRSALEAMGLVRLLPDSFQSNTITTWQLPVGLDYDTLHDHMRAKGYVIYAGQGDLRSRAFRIATMGQLTDEALHGIAPAVRSAWQGVERAEA